MPPRSVTAESASEAMRDLRRLVRVAREFGNGPERAEAPLRAGIGNFAPQQRNVTCGLRHGRRARQLAKDMKRRSPGIGPERIPSQSPRASRPGARPDRHRASERHAGLHEIGAAGQRIGRETSRRKRARDRIVVVERIKDVVDGERPEEMIHLRRTASDRPSHPPRCGSGCPTDRCPWSARPSRARSHPARGSSARCSR